MADLATEQVGFPRVRGVCPMGCGSTLFLGAEGHVTCSWLECRDPSAADRALAGPLNAPERTYPDDDARTRLLVALGDKQSFAEEEASFDAYDAAVIARWRTEEQAVVEAVRRLDFAWGTTGRWDTSFIPEVKAVLEALWAYDRAALARSTPAPAPTDGTTTGGALDA